MNLIFTSSNKAFLPTRNVTLFACIIVIPLFYIFLGLNASFLLYIKPLFFQEKSMPRKYKEKTRENLSCYVKICYNYSNRGFVKGEVGDGRI